MPTYRINHEKHIYALLYYVYTNTYNQINRNCPRVIIMYFCRLVQFHTRRRFRVSLSVRVSDSGHPVTYYRQFCRNKAGRNIYRCMTVHSTRHHTLINNPRVLHTKTFFAAAYHLHQIYLCMSARSTGHHKILNNPTAGWEKL